MKFFIIPSREVMKAVTDKNIQGSSSTKRVEAFDKANFLMAQKDSCVDIIIEGILYNEQLSHRLKDEHKKVFEYLYKIDNSALGVTSYNITKAIKFIAKNKIKLPKRKVIIITENRNEYLDDLCSIDSIKVLTPEEFTFRVSKFIKIKENYPDLYSALITTFIVE